MKTYLLHNIGDRKYGSNYNHLHECIEAGKEGHRLTFDGVYTSVYRHRYELAPFKPILFITGKYIGQTNSFDKGAPRLEHFCDWNMLHDMVDNFGFEFGYHSYSHRDLTTLTSNAELMKEIKPPFPMKYFAYPYGNVNDMVAGYAEAIGYQCAYSVREGNGGIFQLKRDYLNW